MRITICASIAHDQNHTISTCICRHLCSNLDTVYRRSNYAREERLYVMCMYVPLVKEVLFFFLECGHVVVEV